MRILLLSASYIPVLGGLQTVVHELAQGLQRCGHTVAVITNRHPRSLSPEETVDGVTIRRWAFMQPTLELLRQGRGDLWLASLYCYPLLLWRLGRCMQKLRPEVINVHFPDAQIPMVLWLRRHYRFRLVVSLHGHEIDRHFIQDSTEELIIGPPTEKCLHALQRVLREADAVTACSGHLLKRAVRIEPSVAAKGQVLHNGFDPSRFEDTNVYQHPRPYLLAFARMVKKKGLDMLLQAFAHVVSNNPKADLVLAGDGEERVHLECLARSLGIGASVHFYGTASPDEIVNLLNGCCAAVVPSREEAFGIVVLEDLAAGRPTIATRVGGIVELLERVFGDAWIATDAAGDVMRPCALDQRNRVAMVEPTADALARAIAEQLTLPEYQREDARVRNSRIAYFNWENVVQRYEQALKTPAA